MSADLGRIDRPSASRINFFTGLRMSHAMINPHRKVNVPIPAPHTHRGQTALVGDWARIKLIW